VGPNTARLRDGTLSVRVREGQVDLDLAGEVHAARAGEELRWNGAGAGPQRLRIAGSDPAWSWVLATAPPLRIAGRSPREVLELMERESGMVAVWADRSLGSVCAGGPLRSSLPPLELTAALDVALATCGLAVHRRDDRLVVEAMRR
jgi:hypothetical protein